MIPIIVNGKSGSGKSTIIKKLQSKLQRPIIDSGQIFRQAVSEAGITNKKLGDQDKLMEYRRQHPELDKKIDDQVLTELQSKNAIAQSRVLPFLVKDKGVQVFTVFLETSDEVRAQRLGGRDDISAREAMQKNAERDENDRQIYKEIYGIDTNDIGVYDLIVNTDDKNPEEIADIIVKKLPPK